MKMVYTATFAWDGYEPVYYAADNEYTFNELLLDGCINWLKATRANAEANLADVPDTLEEMLETCNVFVSILMSKGPLDCITEMEADCFVSVTFGMFMVPDAATEIFHITDSERFISNRNYHGLTEKDQKHPIKIVS